MGLSTEKILTISHANARFSNVPKALEINYDQWKWQ